jgi:hypothetical protein
MNKLIILASAAAATAFAGTAPSGKGAAPVAPTCTNDDIGASIGVGYDTDFYFRGLSFGEDWISSNVNYSTDVADGVALSLGANYGSSHDQIADYDRLVLNAGLSKDLGFANATLGYRYYNHSGIVGSAFFNDTSEVFFNLTKSVGIINFGLATNYDVTNEGWYFELGANTEVKLTDRISLVPGANIGYANSYNYQLGGTGIDGFTAVTVSLAAPIKLNSRATLTPYIAGRLSVDALDDLGEGNDVYGGVSLTVKF